MTAVVRSLVVALILGLAAATAGRAADDKPHRVAIQVNQDDPAVMNLALNNAENVIEYYSGRGEDVDVEIVTYGPGLHMLRADTSPVKDRIKQIADDKASFPARIVFSACDNTRQNMAKREGHPIPIVPQATIVPSGVVRLMQLQEQGWSYVRP
jgi:intracellular sulfur oxidation DsrE/DsrF family protein